MNTRYKHVFMNEAGAGSAAGGAAEGAAGAASGGEAAAAAAAGAAGTGTVNAGAAAPGTGAPGVPWLATGVETDLVGLAQTKGWQTAADAVKSYRELEKLMGAERAGRTVTLPSDEADAAGWGAIYDKLGRPANAEGYQLPVPEGQDPGFSRVAAAKFHELGISAKTGKALAEWWNQQAAGQTEAQAMLEQQAWQTEDQALRKDWGAEHDMRRELARRAAVSLGLDEKSIDVLEKSTGYSKVLKALAKAGDMMKEHGAEGMGANLGSFSMTPEGARSRRTQLMADKEFRTQATDPKSAQWAELKKLDQIIASVADN